MITAPEITENIAERYAKRILNEIDLPTMNRKILFGLMGVFATSSMLTAIDFAQGMILQDWSGVHPIYRVYQFPLIFLVSIFLGLIVLVLFRLFRLKPISTASGFFRIGLVLGFINLGSVLRPWIGSNGYTEGIVIILVLIFSFVVSSLESKRIIKSSKYSGIDSNKPE